MADGLAPDVAEILADLRDVLSEFVDSDTKLDELAVIALGQRLNAIAAEGLIPNRVFAVILTAYQRSLLIRLVDRALKDYHNPPTLERWSTTYRAKFLTTSEVQTRTSAPDITPQPTTRAESNTVTMPASSPQSIDLQPVMLVARGLRDGEELRQNSLHIRRLRRPNNPEAAEGTRAAMALMLAVLRGTAERARLVYSDVLADTVAQSVDAQFDSLLTAIGAAMKPGTDEDFESALAKIEAAAATIYNTLDVALTQRLAEVGRTPAMSELRFLLEAWRSAVRFLHDWTLCREMLLAGAHRMPFPCFEARADADAVQVLLDDVSPIDLEAKRAAWMAAISAAANTLSAGEYDDAQFNEVWNQAIALSAGIFQSIDVKLRSYPARPSMPPLKT